jgi:propanediol utilization protein
MPGTARRAQLLAEAIHQQQVRAQRVVGQIDGLIVGDRDVAQVQETAGRLRVVIDAHRQRSMQLASERRRLPGDTKSIRLNNDFWLRLNHENGDDAGRRACHLCSRSRNRANRRPAAPCVRICP